MLQVVMQAPHSPLKGYYADEADRSGWLKGLFDRTAVDYDRIERAMALGTGAGYRRRALLRAGLEPGMRVLDIGVGTGLTAREADRVVGPTGAVIGVDPSPGMLERAMLPSRIRLVLGGAEAIPAPDESADFLSMGYALRHVAELSAVFREFKRVLVPGGRLCLLEITAPPGRLGRAVLKTYMRTLVPFLARYLARNRDTPELMRYYWDTIEACAAPEAILAAIREAGFTDVYRVSSLGMFSEYCARKPRVT